MRLPFNTSFSDQGGLVFYRQVFFCDKSDWILLWSAEIDRSESSVISVFLGCFFEAGELGESLGSLALEFLLGMMFDLVMGVNREISEFEVPCFIVVGPCAI